MFGLVPEYLLMIDTSRHNGAFDPRIAKAAGAAIHANRLTVGDYYTDEKGLVNFDAGEEAGLAETFYLVVTPERDWKAQVERYLKEKAGRQPGLATIVDVELDRGQSPNQIALCVRLILAELEQREGKRPYVYTRQSWWDSHVASWSGWRDYLLIAARYATGLSGPWTDGRYKFRDWDEWAAWQFSANGNGQGPKYGGESPDMDLSAAKPEYFGIERPPTLAERVARLEGEISDLELRIANLEIGRGNADKRGFLRG
jgi:GH25 family lysozyme M1 (1,4-beta-N-acetylmuramidase)